MGLVEGHTTDWIGTFLLKRSKRSWRVKVSADGAGVVSHAGVGMLREIGDLTGLTSRVSAVLADTYKGQWVHDPGRVFTDLAAAVADGADCVSGIGSLVDQQAQHGPVASVTTAWRLIDARVDAAHLAGVKAARSVARAAAWAAGAAPSSPSHTELGQSAFTAVTWKGRPCWQVVITPCRNEPVTSTFAPAVSSGASLPSRLASTVPLSSANSTQLASTPSRTVPRSVTSVPVPALGTVGSKVGAGPTDKLGSADDGDACGERGVAAGIDRLIEVTDAVAGPGVSFEAHAASPHPPPAIASASAATRSHLRLDSSTTAPPRSRPRRGRSGSRYRPMIRRTSRGIALHRPSSARPPPWPRLPPTARSKRLRGRRCRFRCWTVPTTRSRTRR